MACAIAAGAALALTSHLLHPSGGRADGWRSEPFIAGGTLLAIYGMTRWWWSRPMTGLIDLIAAVRAGEAPIEALSDVRRGPRRIVPVVQELLRELRQQRCDLATLNEEMRQRVAQRTNALERTIGSLRQQATRDALTGLFNRRFLDTYLPQMVSRCVGQKMDLALVIGDLDHFKSLNDTLGHAAGDELLRSVGQLIRSTVRGEDAAFRLGGDEFVVVMPGGTAEHGCTLAQRLSSLVEALGRTYKLPNRPRLSCGVACITQVPDRSAAGLMSLADQALYACKRDRRTDWVVASRDVPSPLQAAGSSLQCPAPVAPSRERGLKQ